MHDERRIAIGHVGTGTSSNADGGFIPRAVMVQGMIAQLAP